MQEIYQEYRKRLQETVITDGRITEIEFMKEQIPDPVLGIRLSRVPECCRVCVNMKPSEESDINVEIWLPVFEWNGNFLGTGNGGYAGRIDKLSLMNGVSRGYAAANTDMGTSPDPDELIGKPERWADFGYRATHLMTVASKQVIHAFYGKSPEYSYFCGGSTGGQQGLMEAQRYPEDYNGIVVIAPANNRVRLHTAFVWNWQALCRNPKAGIRQREADAVSECFIQHYKILSGSTENDKFLSYPDRISADFRVLEQLEEQSVLNEEQMKALKKIYAGAADPVTGEQIFVPWIPGCENLNLGLVQQSDKESFSKEFFYLFRWIYGKNFDFMEFDFHKHYQEACKKLGPFLNASESDLTAFQNAGGKLLMISGTADPIIPYTDAMEYYRKVAECHGGIEQTQKFFRYFLMPGMGHVFGGPGIKEVGMLGIDQVPKDKKHDVISAIAAWVENGEAPETMTPVLFKDCNMANEIAGERKVSVYNCI